MTSATHSPDRSGRAMLIECVIVTVIVLAAYAATRPSAVATLGRLYDDVVYLSVGKSIADGHGYRSAQLVGTPVHAKFPPLLPAIYAAGWIRLGSLDAVARFALWLNIVVASASAGALWWLARRELRLGIVSTTLFVIVPIITDRTMFYFSGAASEPWMLLGWTVSLLLVRRLTRLAASGATTNAAAIVLGLTLAATVLSRTQGIAIAIGVLAGLALSGVGWRAVVVAIVATAVPLLAWSAWHEAMMAKGPLSPLPDQRSYLAWIPLGGVGELAGFIVRMTRTSVPLYWSNVATVLVGWTSPKTLMVAAALLVWGAIGVVLLTRSFPAIAASILAMMGVLAIWPYVQDRFLTPVLPMLGLVGAFAVEQTLVRLPTLLQRATIGLAALLAGALLYENARLRLESVRGEPRSPFVHALADITDWVELNTSPEHHVMVSWGGAVYLRTGRRTSIPNPEEPTLGTSVLDSPYRFYATRLLADSVDDVIIWDRAPGRAAVRLRELGARCPGLLTESARDSAAADRRNGVHFYRVQRNLPCLAFESRRDAPATGNKNAP